MGLGGYKNSLNLNFQLRFMKSFVKLFKSLSCILTIVVVVVACGNNATEKTSMTNSTEEKEVEKPKGDTSTNVDQPSSIELAKVEKETPKEEVEIEEKVKSEPQKEKKEIKKKPRKRAKMHFPDKVYDYGFIMQGDTVQHDFYFKNVGNDDLVIKRVEPSCGCTVPLYPKEPIAPGGEGKISVTFKSAGKLGRQVPSIKVITNYKRAIKLEMKGYVDAEREKKTPALPVVEAPKDTIER